MRHPASTGTTIVRPCRTATSATTRPRHRLRCADPLDLRDARRSERRRRSVDGRGPLIGFFTGLKGSLQDFVNGSFSEDIAAVAQNFESSKSALDEVNEECSFPPNIIKCPIALAKLGITVIGDAFGAAVDAAEAVVKEGARLLLSSYVHAWIEDIDSGLHAWGELGLASTRALFDPQTRRDLQNEECASKEPDDQRPASPNCEDGIGAVDVLVRLHERLRQQSPAVDARAPDFVGVARGAIQDAMDTLGKALDVVLNPIAQPLAAIEDFAKEQIKQLVSDAIGIDVDQLNDFIKHPTSWLNVGSVAVTLPVVGTQTLHLFESGQHAALDGTCICRPTITTGPPTSARSFAGRRRVRPEHVRRRQEHDHDRKAAPALAGTS